MLCKGTATPPASTAPEPTLRAHELAEQAADLVSIVLTAITEEFGQNELDAVALDLGLRDADGTYWATITDGPQPFYQNRNGDPVNFFHIVAVHRLNNDNSWSQEIDRISIDTAPQRTGDAEVVGLDVAPGSAWIVIRGPTGAHAGTLDVIRFDGSLSTALSHLSSRPKAGEVIDLDGDGLPEFVLNDSNPYVFCYACAVEEAAVRIHRWSGSGLSEVELAVPRGLPEDATADARRVVALAEADLWREAVALAVETASVSPDHDGLRWLSILVNQMAARRLGNAGSPGQPLLTNLFAGEYGAALEQMRAHAPSEVFALDGPLISGTAAETDLATMAVAILDYSERAHGQRPTTRSSGRSARSNSIRRTRSSRRWRRSSIRRRPPPACRQMRPAPRSCCRGRRRSGSPGAHARGQGIAAASCARFSRGSRASEG